MTQKRSHGQLKCSSAFPSLGILFEESGESIHASGHGATAARPRPAGGSSGAASQALMLVARDPPHTGTGHRARNYTRKSGTGIGGSAPSGWHPPLSGPGPGAPGCPVICPLECPLPLTGTLPSTTRHSFANTRTPLTRSTRPPFGPAI